VEGGYPVERAEEVGEGRGKKGREEGEVKR
jgi:hypothetical protein